MSITLLVIDDDPGSLALAAAALEQDGVDILTCEDPEEAIELARARRPQIVISDLVMPRMSGIEVVERVLAIDPAANVILLTGHYSTESALEAIRKGACDYLTKPISPARLRERVDELIAEVRRRERAEALDRELVEAHRFHGVIGRSPGMLDVFRRIQRLAPHYRTVLVQGATGTGKELAARALHDLSPVAKGPFAVCNCAALPESLVESELFGYARGAFTGATQDKPGLFEHANQGTLFLDEIGELPLAAQAKILRAIQNQELQRLGSPAPRKVNVRVIAATHRDLRRMCAEQKFRDDLLYRIAMVELRLPPLRDRGEDLPLLMRHFVEHYAAQYGKRIDGFTERAEGMLLRYDWPGNVRELEGVIGSAALMAEGRLIDAADLPQQFRERGLDRAASSDEDVLISLEEAERRHARQVLDRLHGDKVEAARVLGVSRSTLYRLIGSRK